MGSSQWPQGSRLRSVQRLWPWLLLLVALGLVRFSKGAGFADAFALISRPFWPGTAQREWVQSATKQEEAARLLLLEEVSRSGSAQLSTAAAALELIGTGRRKSTESEEVAS